MSRRCPTPTSIGKSTPGSSANRRWRSASRTSWAGTPPSIRARSPRSKASRGSRACRFSWYGARSQMSAGGVAPPSHSARRERREQRPCLGLDLEAPVRQVGGRGLLQRARELLPRLHLALEGHIKPRQLHAERGAPRIDLEGAAKVLLRPAYVSSERARHVGGQAPREGMATDRVGIEAQHEIGFLSQLREHERALEHAFRLS